MTWRVVLCLFAMASLAVGCASKPWKGLDVHPIPIGDVDAHGQPVDGPAGWQGRVTAVGRNLPSIPNAMLQLPVVSPDSKWIAFLERELDAPGRANMDAAISGRGLAGVNLRLRALDAEGPGTMIAERACWPAWSPDGRQLVFILYDPEGRCFLGLHDMETGVTARKAVGLRKMLMPRLSPDGRTVAVIAYGQLPDQATLFLVDLSNDQATPGPPTEAGAQLLPRWVDDQTLLLLELVEDGARLVGWRRGQPAATPIATLAAPPSIFDAQHLLAGIPQPLRPGGGTYAVFDPASRRLQLVDLVTGDALPLDTGTMAGAWWGGDWFVAAGQDQIRLLAIPPRVAQAVGEPLPSVRLFDGRWAPLHADRETKSLVLVGEGDDADTFNLVQLWLTAEAGGPRQPLP